MKFVAWMLVFTLSQLVFAEAPVDEASSEIQSAGKSTLFKKVSEDYAQGKYKASIEELEKIEKKLKADKNPDNNHLGLTYYWKGIAYGRLQDYPLAIKNYKNALQLNYAPQDIHYEYGQALYASEKMVEARNQFKESLKNNFKRGVSLYYIGFISKELGERKKAFTFFKAINKLNPDEAAEVKQAAEMLIGDIYLEQVEKHPDSFRAVESVVIPQYEKAIEVNPESPLAPVVKDKITSLQRKYDLILFNLRNGRPTLQPPYFLRAVQDFSHDTNVTYNPTETTISKSRQGSNYSRTELMGRYTFYYHDFLSIAPELRLSNTYYFNRVPEIYRNDNYFMAPALRTAYEHTFRKKPASFLFDYDYNESHRDVEAEQKLKFASRSHSFTAGEKFTFFERGETTLRLRRRFFESYLSTSDSKTTSFIFEQIVAMNTNTLLLYSSYDMTRVTTHTFDTDALTVRGDIIMSKVRDWFTPSFGLAITSTNPINDRTNRGRELLINPSARIARAFSKHWRGNLKYDYSNNNSKDKANFAYKKQVYGFELEYIF